jgi:hypothetical protein
VARFGLKRWWQSRHPGPWRVALVVSEADQIPITMSAYQAVLVAPEGKSKWLAFDCPCGTGHRVMLNLDRARWPYWTVFSDAPLTISPSVDMETSDRRCHYLLYYGHVNWVPAFSFGREHREPGRSWRTR